MSTTINEKEYHKLPIESKECEFLVYQKKWFYKYYKYPRSHDQITYDRYIRAFKAELDAMRTIQRKYPNTKYFPKYLNCGLFDNKPCIRMEYIRGITLEKYLQKRASVIGSGTAPSMDLLSSTDRKRILEQLYEALQILYDCNILHFDINPANIIILNKNFDIKLIDFTFFYDLNKSDAENNAQKYKRNDSRLRLSDPVALRMANALLYFYMQSFYPTADDYLEHSSSDEAVFHFFCDSCSLKCADLLHRRTFTRESFPSADWSLIECPPQNNQLYIMERYLKELFTF